MTKVRNLIEASLYPERYEYGLEQLGGGNTTNLLFLLKIYKKTANKEPISYVLKSYKDYSGSLEPRTLFVLVKNNFPNAPKIYGTIKLQGKETIGILEDVPNIGNLGDIYWDEVNKMMYDVFKRVNDDYSFLNNREDMSNIIKKHCGESLKVSEKIGFQIKKLHKALILTDDPIYSKKMVDSKNYLKNYTDNLNSMVNKIQSYMNKKSEGAFYNSPKKIQSYMNKKSEGAFYNSPKITSILLDIKDIIEKFRSEFEAEQITIQPVHQDLHFQQILYNKNNGDYMFYFIDFEGDPQLSREERKGGFPIEKDLASFLRSLSYIKFNTLINSLSYIKFNTLINFIEKVIIDKGKFEVPAEFLFSLYFRKSSKISKKHKTLEIALNLLNLWENKLMGKIIDKSLKLKLHFTLINYFTIERTLHELNYELLFRPNNSIIPILGLKEIIEKN
jgi:hypothetical protein